MRCKSQGRKFKVAAVFSVKLEKWSFHVADLPRTGKKCTEIKKAREGRAKLLFCFIKYAKFVALSLPSRRTSKLSNPGGVLPYMGHIGMCRCEGYGFQAVYSSIGYINQSVWV